MSDFKELKQSIDNLSSVLLEFLKKFNGISMLSNYVPEKDITSPMFFDWLEEWYVNYKVPKLKEKSLKSIRICIDNHIKPNIENKPLDKLTGLDIQKALNKIKLSRTRKITYNIYNASLRQARKLKIINDDVMISVEPVKHEYKTGKALAHEQQKYFYKIIERNMYRDLYCFYILSGCRRSEAINLLWSDIDFNNKFIHIRGTKTKNSDRILPLFPAIEQLLNKLPKVSDKVFNCTENAIKCNFKRLKTQYNLSFRLHDLRHTFATRCLENGISMKIIQKWLGHSRLETTANIYTHVLTSFEKEEIAKYNPDI